MTGLRGTLVLLAIVAALIGGLYFTGDGTPEGPDTAESALDDRRLLAAVGFMIRNQPDVQPIEFERSPEFRLVEPLRDLASAARLEALAGAWDGAMLHRVYRPEDLTDDILEQTGLVEPRAEMSVRFEDHEVSVEIGEEGPLGHEVYVRKNGSVYLGSAVLYSSLAGTPDDFRERLVFRTPPSAARRLSIVRNIAGKTDRLSVRMGAGHYELEEPIRARASGPDVQVFLSSVLGIPVDGYVAGNITPPGDPNYVIEVEGPYGTERLELWRSPDGSVVGWQQPRELVFVIEGRELGRLLESPAVALRSRLLVKTPPDDVVQITLDPGAGRGPATVLRRGADQLLAMERPVKVATSPTTVGKLLEGLRHFVVTDFVASDPASYGDYGLDRDYLTLEIKGNLEPKPDVVLIGDVVGDVCYVRRADEPYVVAVPALCRDAFSMPWTEFVSTTAHRMEGIDNVRQFHLARGPHERLYLRDDSGDWSLEGLVVEDVADVVEELCDVRAAAALDPATVSRDDPVSLELRAHNGMPLRRFFVSRGDQGLLFWLPESGVVFRLGSRLSALLGPLLP